MGVAKMTKEGVTITINDRPIVVKALTWKELGKFESYIRSLRIAELHAALELTKPAYPAGNTNISAYPPGAPIPPDVLKYNEWMEFKLRATNDILKAAIAAEDMAAAENTIDGLLMVIRLGLRDNDNLDTFMDELVDMENREQSRADIALIRQVIESGWQEENPPEPESETTPPVEQETQPAESE